MCGVGLGFGVGGLFGFVKGFNARQKTDMGQKMVGRVHNDEVMVNTSPEFEAELEKMRVQAKYEDGRG